MDGTAVKAIQDLAVAALCGTMPEGSRAVALPGDFAIFDVEKHQPHRQRFRGVYNTESIEDFVKYTTDRKVPTTQGYITATNNHLCAFAYFNLREEDASSLDGHIVAGHGDDRAVLALEQTPAFAALTSTDNAKLNQRDIVNFIEDWQDFITSLDAEGNAIEIRKALNALRNVKLEQVSGLASQISDTGYEKTEHEKLEMKGATDSLPVSFVFSGELYAGLAVREIPLRFIIGGDGTLAFTLRIPRRTVIEESIAAEFKTLLQTQLKDVGDFYLGSFTL